MNNRLNFKSKHGVDLNWLSFLIRKQNKLAVTLSCCVKDSKGIWEFRGFIIVLVKFYFNYYWDLIKDLQFEKMCYFS